MSKEISPFQLKNEIKPQIRTSMLTRNHNSNTKLNSQHSQSPSSVLRDSKPKLSASRAINHCHTLTENTSLLKTAHQYITQQNTHTSESLNRPHLQIKGDSATSSIIEHDSPDR